MLIGVTGANGFVGRRLVEDLLQRGHDVRAISRTPLQARRAGLSWMASPDLSASSADWAEVMAGLDVVIHVAARVHVMNDSAADPLGEFRKANVEGTMAIARAAKTQGVSRLVFASSIKVNGESASVDQPFTASDTPQPSDPYGVSKMEAEHALQAFARTTGLEVVIVRPVLVYGPGVKANFQRLVSAVAKGMPLPFGGVENRRSLVFVGNLSDLLIRTAEHPAAAGRVFLASDGEDLSTADLIRRLAGALQSPARLLPAPVGLVNFLARLTGKEAVARRLYGSLAVNITATREDLGWMPPYTVEQGLEETAAWFQAAQE